MTVILANNDRALSLFKSVLDLHANNEIKDCSLFVVQHVVPNTIPLFKFLNLHFNLRGVIPKPNSIDMSTLDFITQMEDKIPILHCNREQLKSEKYLKENIIDSIPENEKLILLDVGGYFSSSINILYNLIGERFLGVVEDTENGHQKYQSKVDKARIHSSCLPVPVISVARSPLKEPEDYLVGQSIVYSIERVLRENNTLLTNKQALVLGYGKIGKSISNSLSARNISVWVYDIDPIRSAQASSHGYLTPRREEAIINSDLIIGATGNKSLIYEDFIKLKPFCFVSSVTSEDDEFNFGELRKNHTSRNNNSGLEIFYLNGKVVHLMNKGNAINFLHNNVLGPYIYLVASELIAATCKMYFSSIYMNMDKINSLTTPERKNVASEWQEVFVYE